MKKNERSGFRIVDHTADIALSVTGNTIKDLLQNSLNGLIEIITEKPIKSENVKKISFKINRTDTIIIEFLNEMLYLINVKKWFPNKICSLEIDNKILQTELLGNGYSSPDIITTEIKAATYHNFHVKEINGCFKTKIYFDI